MIKVSQVKDTAEIPVFFPAGGETLFGILTEPHDPIGAAAILLRGGGQGPCSERNQIDARLCRRLSEDGFHAFRFDYHGVGESTGAVERFRLDEPFEEDVEAAINWLRGRGIERFILIGGCFGARTALACAARVPGLEGLVLKALPVRDKEKDETGTWPLVPDRTVWQYASRAFRPHVVRALFSATKRRGYLRVFRAAWRARTESPEAKGDNPAPRWLSTALLSNVETALQRSIPILFVSGTKDPGFGDFDRAMSARLGEILQESGSLVDAETLAGRVGGADASLQQPVIDLIAEWLGHNEEVDHSNIHSPANLELRTFHA